MPRQSPAADAASASTRTSRSTRCGFRKLAQRALGQHGIAILPDFRDLAALQAKHQAIVVVVAHAFPRDVVALGLHHDMIAVGDETMRDRSRAFGETRAHMSMKIVEDRLLADEGARPGILTGHGPGRVVGKTCNEQRAIAHFGIWIAGGGENL